MLHSNLIMYIVKQYFYEPFYYQNRTEISGNIEDYIAIDDYAYNIFIHGDILGNNTLLLIPKLFKHWKYNKYNFNTVLKDYIRCNGIIQNYRQLRKDIHKLFKQIEETFQNKQTQERNYDVTEYKLYHNSELYYFIDWYNLIPERHIVRIINMPYTDLDNTIAISNTLNMPKFKPQFWYIIDLKDIPEIRNILIGE